MALGHTCSWRIHAFILAGMWAGSLAVRTSCPANPIGGVVINGNAVIENSVPGLTTITQSTDRAIIDWQSFSIGAGERTNFILPDATSATLNRVLGCDPSILNGSLTSNGNLFLINSNGIVFGQGAYVDVGGLTASTLDLDNSAFMAGGEMVFQGSSEAAVKNAGTIKASTGDVFLIGYQVKNSGTIRAPNGTVGLAAGSEVLLMPVGDERVVVRNASGSSMKTGVSNSGTIEANIAELKAHGGNVYALAIRNTGRVAATGVTQQGGRILLSANGGKIESTGSLAARRMSGNGGQIRVSAGRTGNVTIGGRVDADGPDGSGGSVAITGEKVTIRKAIAVSADGAIEGGQISIGSDAPAGSDEASASETKIEGIVSADSSNGAGGEIHLGGSTLLLRGDALISSNGATGGGKIFAGSSDSLTPASVVEIDCEALLSANALENGTGGQIVVWAGDELTFQGRLQALGGATSGAGGHAELKAGESLNIDRLTGRVDLSATNGSAGSLLVQSSEIVIANPADWEPCPRPANTLEASDVSNFLNSANLTLQARFGTGGGSGNVYLKGTVAWSSVNSLTISTDCDFLMLNEDVGVGVIDAQGGGDVTVNAARSVLLESGTAIGTTTGNVLINANQGDTSFAGASRGITIAGSITAAGGSVTLVGRAGAGSCPDTPAILVESGTVRADGGGILTLKTTGGTVVSNGSLIAAKLVLDGSGSFTLTGSNAIGTVATSGTVASITLENGTGLTIGSVGTASGLSASGDIHVTLSGTNALLIGKDVVSQGGLISLSANRIDVNGATISSASGPDAILSANQFFLLNQPVIQGLLIGTGATPQISLDDTNLTIGQNYTILADRIIAGSRAYAFQNVSSIRLDLGSGNDTSDTNFFVFDQFLNAGNGTNQLLVGGVPPSGSPLTRPGFGTITFTGFVVQQAAPTVSPISPLILQNAIPGGGAGGGSSQTNNFNSTSTSGATAGGTIGVGAAGISGGLASAIGVTGLIGQSLNLVTTGGGAPPSFGLQSQMNSSTSAVTESELNLALGGDGTMRARSSTGLVPVDPSGGGPSQGSLALLADNMSLLALSELSFGALGLGQVTVTSSLGVQSITLGEPPPVAGILQDMTLASTPESFSRLLLALGGDGTARIDQVAGGIAIDLMGRPTPAYIEARLGTNMTPGVFGELSLALGGTGEFVVNDLLGLTIIDPSGFPPGPQVLASVFASLAPSVNSLLSMLLGAEGTAVLVPEDGIQSAAFDGVQLSPGLTAELEATFNPQNLEELDNAAR